MLSSSIILTMLLLMFAGTVKGANGPWQLSTDDTAIQISVIDNRPVVISLTCKGSPHNWAEEGATLSLMDKVWKADTEAKLEWRLREASLDEKTGTLTLIFSNDSPKLTLKSFWRASRGRGPIEHWIEITNETDGKLTISHQDSLTLPSLQCGADAEVWWISRGGNNAIDQGGVFRKPAAKELDLTITSIPENGAAPVPWMAVQVGEERGLYVGWEFSGVGRIQANGSENGLSLSIGNTPDFQTDISPGETFIVPIAFVGCYDGSIDDGSYQLHSFIIEKLRPKLPADCPDPILTYNCFFSADGTKQSVAQMQQDVMPCVEAAHEMGFEAFVFDAIWYAQVGDWRWPADRFPGGIKPFHDYTDKAGLRIGYWCAWTNAGTSTDPGALSARGENGHPEWLRADPAPDSQPGIFWGVEKICLGSPEAMEWAKNKTHELVKRDKLDYLKHDIEMITARCNKTGHRHKYASDVSYWSATGLYEIQDSLHKDFPSLILENCSAGGCIKDFGVIQRSHYTVTTDTLANLANRMSIHDSTYAFPPMILQAYTVENWTDDPGDKVGTFMCRSAMMGAWVIDPRSVARWTEEQRAEVKRCTTIYKQWLRPVMRDCEVHHILPRPDGKNWDGLFYWNATLKRGTLYIFRPNSQEAKMSVKLRGLDEKTKYRLWSEDGSVSPTVKTGAELTQQGLSIALPAIYTCDLIFIQDESLGEFKGFDDGQ